MFLVAYLLGLWPLSLLEKNIILLDNREMLYISDAFFQDPEHFWSILLLNDWYRSLSVENTTAIQIISIAPNPINEPHLNAFNFFGYYDLSSSLDSCYYVFER